MVTVYTLTCILKHMPILSLYIRIHSELGIRSLASLTSPNTNSGSAKAGLSQKPENEYTGRSMVHLDAFCWVKRDSYLPQGTQGLKAVTRAKLGYEPGTV